MNQSTHRPDSEDPENDLPGIRDGHTTVDGRRLRLHVMKPRQRARHDRPRTLSDLHPR